MAEFVEIFEVGPRDGLQNEPRPIPTAEKIALVDLLSQTGFRRIEVASFVSPKWVPQMSDSAEVLAGITRRPGVSYAALAPNLKGYRAAVAAGADEVAVFVSASEGFSKANLNCSVAESLERLASIAEAARQDGTRLRGYVSMVVECPFDGPTPPASVARVAAALRDLGCAEISLGDTVGRATAEGFDAMLAAVLGELPADRLAAHCHDTAGRALEVIDAALARGLRVVDAAVGGLGGCPYAPGAAGNVATEKVAAHLAAKGFETGLDPDRLAEAAALARRLRAG
ncbi:hydroxymethylglutaryl-CoA lyase [Cereibacter sphaeroides]|uniref:hydroxymethylglutaryl-CoA lyase n=1 Tax=Cereibacter sphaeroides TaxID=1063 RepID=UPI001F1F7BBE|nr:hydroxymethylglutaryl-CoA lyase [Cereibacter sphaeroides]MCE6953395.1 hydroxymethylglutaryl-CoA lyase [Cereibacter sphaeroides]